MMLVNTRKGAILATSMYIDGTLCDDDVEVTPPDIEYATTEITQGLEIPLAGVFQAMEYVVKVKGISDTCVKLGQPEQHTVIVNAVQQVVGIDGTVKNEQVKYTTTGIGKKSPSSSTKAGEAGSREYALAVTAHKETVNGKVVHDIDIYGNKQIIGGKDYCKDVKSKL